ncbi:hypothetical protein OBBRIDRAFT_820879 [Obba rivulosa]|uniref:Heterokaryon incompatibility domain-containing protein n=1 Tax=Obba rivulosa TaxID=1052685 RepID=A0A8E2AWV3_9APHY|nr:hypothetical protein OBBRIDRAFT_820879 [Obba rivulosa]
MKLFVAAQISRLAGSKKLREQVYAIIRQVQLMLTRASDWEDEHEYTLSQCEVLCSIHVLLRLLSLAFLCHSPHSNLDTNDDMRISVADLTVDWKPEGQIRFMDFAWTRLIGRGWCRSEIRHLLQGFNIATLACYLERPDALRNHSNCTDTTCMAYQIDETNYRTLHVNEDCNCASISVDPTHLRDVLASNQIPKVAVSEDLKLSVVDGKGYTYVAISHVWADGLGNPFQNSIPTCQIRRLLRLITELCRNHNLLRLGRSRIALWIDTLCIPVAPQFKEYRKLAIQLLPRTYSDASAVLVLDRELCNFESRRASILELGIRVVCSGWMKRLWTLQEASIAGAGHGGQGPGSLYIQMADGSARWDRSSRSFHYKPFRAKAPPPKPSALTVTVQEVKADLLYEMHTHVSMEDRLPSVRDIQWPRFETRFQKIMGAVQNRSTSKSEDEPICMASLLGLDLSRILSTEAAEDRMAAFYRLLHEIPTAVIFAHFGMPDFASRNLQMKPFRWAPKSLLLLEDPMVINLALAAQRFANPPWPLHGLCEEDGLHVQHSGFVFSEPGPVTLCNGHVLNDAVCGEYYSLSWPGANPECIGPEMCLALVFQTDFCSDAVIVRIDSQCGEHNDTEYYVTIIGHGTVKARGAIVTEEQISTICGRTTARDQRWCFT